MKKLLWILGGLVCTALVVAAMYVALTIGISVYIFKMNRSRVQAAMQAQTAREQQQMQESIKSLGDNMTPGNPKQSASEVEGKLPSLFSDPGDDKTEDNWLATSISREIAGMAFLAAHPDATLPAMKVKAAVNLAVPEKPQVKVEIDGFGGDGTITSDLTPGFAWEANGYAPLAAQFLGGKGGSVPAPDATPNDILGLLLDLTGKNLAAEDMLISRNLQQHPDSWQDHEAAALLLTAMALREGTGVFADNRLFLNKATAHLAMAQALRGNQKATWPGLIAGAAIRTLAGRELDALAHLDNLNAQPDLPPAARTWIAALRMLAKADRRMAEVTEKSPLLLKIVWFRVLRIDLAADEPEKRLAKIVPNSPEDSAVQSGDQKVNPEALIPDWGRTAGTAVLSGIDDSDPKKMEYNMDLEFHDLDEIMKAEGEAPLDLSQLASVYSESETDTVTDDASGKAMVNVVGVGSFKAASLRQILSSLPRRDNSPDSWQDPAQAKDAFNKLEKLLDGVPGYEVARQHTGFVDYPEPRPTYEKWLAEKKTWPVWALPADIANGMPGYGLVKAFYANAVPFGTVYQADSGNRLSFIRDVGAPTPPPYDTAELEKIKQLPVNQAMPAIATYNQKYNALLAASPRVTNKLIQELFKLAPDNFELALDNTPPEKLKEVAMRFLEYNVNVIDRLGNLDKTPLTIEDRRELLEKQAQYNPAAYFWEGNYLRCVGKEDEAAEADRRGYEGDG